jgi:hypothetical protein
MVYICMIDSVICMSIQIPVYRSLMYINRTKVIHKIKLKIALSLVLRRLGRALVLLRLLTLRLYFITIYCYCPSSRVSPASNHCVCQVSYVVCLFERLPPFERPHLDGLLVRLVDGVGRGSRNVHLWSRRGRGGHPVRVGERRRDLGQARVSPRLPSRPPRCEPSCMRWVSEALALPLRFGCCGVREGGERGPVAPWWMISLPRPFGVAPHSGGVA